MVNRESWMVDSALHQLNINIFSGRFSTGRKLVCFSQITKLLLKKDDAAAGINLFGTFPPWWVVGGVADVGKIYSTSNGISEIMC